MIYIGNEPATGEHFKIPLGHTFVSGITQAGKTTTLKRMISEAEELGWTVLVIDVKAKPKGLPDFANIGVKAPVHLKQHHQYGVDPLALKGLLESASKLRLNFQFAELINVSKGKFMLGQVLDEIKKRLEGHIHPITKEKLEVLQLLLDRLVKEMEQVDYVQDLRLDYGRINVMDCTKFSSGLKQLVVRSVAETVRNEESEIIVVFDEAHIHVPQGYSSASKQAVTTLIKEGAGSTQFVWLADQSIKEVDKDVLKQVGIWLVGRQMEGNEVKRAYDLLPYKEGFKEADIQKLGVGDFLVATSEYVKKVHIEPHMQENHRREPLPTPSEKVVSQKEVMPWGEVIRPLPPIKDEEVPEHLIKRAADIDRRIEEIHGQ